MSVLMTAQQLVSKARVITELSLLIYSQPKLKCTQVSFKRMQVAILEASKKTER